MGLTILNLSEPTKNNNFEKHKNTMQQQEIIKLFESFPLLIIGKTKDQKRMREFVIINPDYSFSVASEGVEPDENGLPVFYAMKHGGNFATIQELRKFMMIRQDELISLS